MKRQDRPETDPDPTPRERRRRFRLFARGVFFLVAVAALWPLAPGADFSHWIAALSPFVALAGVIATRAFPVVAWLGVVIVAVVLVKHRFFCRWACPLGFCLDGAGRLGRRLGRRPGRTVPVGRWVVLLTLGGACLGYPLLLWLDPLAIFTSVFAVCEPQRGHGAWLAAAGFAVVLVLSILRPNLWCGHVCPLGAFQDLLHRVPAFLRFGAGRNGAPRHVGGTGGGFSRRAILGAVVGASSAGLMGVVGRDKPRPLRPPNTRSEPQFVGLCTRCGNCLRSCPSRIIERDLGGHGWAGLGTPVLRFRDGYCREDCTRCTEVCPSGAIERLRVGDKQNIRIGLPRVDMNVCRLGDDRECSICARWCPYGAIRYVFSETEYTLKPQIDPSKCTGCGACEAACPTRPAKAIVIVPA